jgi:hypothetical protein
MASDSSMFSDDDAPLASQSGHNGNASRNSHVVPNGIGGYHPEDEDTPMSEDDGIPLVCIHLILSYETVPPRQI